MSSGPKIENWRQREERKRRDAAKLEMQTSYPIHAKLMDTQGLGILSEFIEFLVKNNYFAADIPSPNQMAAEFFKFDLAAFTDEQERMKKLTSNT